jgi:L-ribulose-5-phosphate 4-epimerase
MSIYQDLKNEAYLANMQLPKLGLVLFTFGNVSVSHLDERIFAIKPSGIPYEELTPELIVIVDFDGNVIEGEMRPSSDTRTHAVLYSHWGKIRSIVHTHSTYATAWAQSLLDIPILGTTHADHSISAIPCASPMSDEMILGDYETQTGYQILECFDQRGLDPYEMEMMLVGSHAPFTWGLSSQKAVYNAAVLEEIARMAFLTLQINPNAPELKEKLIRKHYERKHGPDAYYGQ